MSKPTPRSERIEHRRALLEQEQARMIALLSGRQDIERVVVFGSFARGEVGPGSDIDLLIVQRSSQRFLDRLHEMYRFLAPRVACDILVYTPEELPELASTSRMVSQALEHGRSVYAAKPRA
jgi:predicted nucleotidyltransferase